MRDRILAKGVSPERVVVVRDGASIFRLPCRTRTIRAYRKFACGFPFVVLHAGNLGFYGAWAHAVQSRGNSAQRKYRARVYRRRGKSRRACRHPLNGSPNVRFLPFRPVEQIPHVMMAGDLHIVTVRRGLEGVVVPSKLYSILAAGRPILAVAAPESDAARIVSEIRLRNVRRSGRSRPQWRRRSASFASDPHRLAEMGRRARETAGKYARVNELRKVSSES